MTCLYFGFQSLISPLHRDSSMATAGTSAPSRWMISPWWDGILFIASPLLCALVILPLGSVIGSLEIYAFVLAFVSFGHHLPGFMRAYGDHDLFTQYRLRFIWVLSVLSWHSTTSPSTTWTGWFCCSSCGICGIWWCNTMVSCVFMMPKLDPLHELQPNSIFGCVSDGSSP